jgi:hypothetical protein
MHGTNFERIFGNPNARHCLKIMEGRGVRGGEIHKEPLGELATFWSYVEDTQFFTGLVQDEKFRKVCLKPKNFTKDP